MASYGTILEAPPLGEALDWHVPPRYDPLRVDWEVSIGVGGAKAARHRIGAKAPKARNELEKSPRKERLRSDTSDIWPREWTAERARVLRRKERLEHLTSAEETELARLHSILDQPTQKELSLIHEEEERDRRRFQKLLDEFDRIVKTLQRTTDG